MSYAYRILPRAEADAQRIASYIRKRSLQGANSWIDAYQAAIDRVCLNPLSGLLAPENGRFEWTLYQALFSTKSGRRYRFVYLFYEDTVIIVRVRGPGQQLLRKRDLPFD